MVEFIQTDPNGPRPNRVAYVVSRFPKLTETFVLFEALALEELGLEVHFFPLVPHTEEVQHHEVERFADRVHRLPAISGAALRPGLRAPLRAFRAFGSLLRGSGLSAAHLLRAGVTAGRMHAMAERMQVLGIGHIHAHFANHPALAARVVHDLTGIPYSFTAHGSDLHRDSRGLRHKVAGSSFTVAISKYNRRFILDRIGEAYADQVLVLHCGVDLSRWTDLPRPLRRADEPLQIACVAALRAVKGHTHLLGALQTLREGGVPFHLRCAGEGPLREALTQEIERRGLTSHVTLLGPQTRDQVQALLSSSHVIALTSIQDSAGRREGIPVSLMEGMAAGLPVVSSQLSGIPELVQDGVSGILTTPGDEPALTAAFACLAADPDLAHTMGRAGRTTVRAEFDLAHNARQLAQRLHASLAS